MQGWVQYSIEDAEWYVAPDWQHVLFDEQGLRWSLWKQLRCIEIIKNAPHRIIYRVAIPEHFADDSFATFCPVSTSQTSVYIKCYPLTGMRGLLERQGFSFKTKLECEKALLLKERGLPTIEPIAFGKDSSQAYLITLALPNVTPLDAWLSTIFPKLPLQEQIRVRLILPRLLARLLALMHRAGFYHRDLHAGNLLVRYQQKQDLEIFIIDTRAICHQSKPLSWRHARRNLIMFGRWFLERTNVTDRRRFFHYYVQFRTDWRVTNSQEQVWALQLEQSIRDSLYDFYRRLESYPWHNNRYFYRWHYSRNANNLLHSNHWQAWAVRELATCSLQKIVGQASRILPTKQNKNQGIEPFTRHEVYHYILSPCALIGEIKSLDHEHSGDDTCPLPAWQDRGRRGGFWQTVLSVAGQPTPVIVKAFRLGAWRQRWAERLRLGPASRSWHNSYRLLTRLFPTARALALLHCYEGLLPSWALLICERLENHYDLRQALTYLSQQHSDRNYKRWTKLTNAVAELVARLHRYGFSHRDLKAAHFLIADDYITGNCDDLKISLVDLVGMTRPFVLTKARRVQNLARLQVSFHGHPLISRSDRLRFLKAYLHAVGGGDTDWKWWWRRIARVSQRKLARNQRSQRPVT